MTLHSAGYGRVVIPGMSGFTFYILGRFFHQLGVSQGRTRAGIDGFNTSPFTIQRVIAFQHRWGNRGILAADPDFSTGLTNWYITWLRADIEARNNNEDSD